MKDRFPILFGALAVVVIGGGVHAALTKKRARPDGAKGLVVDTGAPTRRADEGGGTIAVEAPLPEGPLVVVRATTEDDLARIEERIDALEVDDLSSSGATVGLVTRGLAALGVPELVIRDVPPGLAGEAADLLHGIAYQLATGVAVGTGSTLDVPLDDGAGGIRTVRVHLSRAGEQIAIVFPGTRGRVSERVGAALGAAPVHDESDCAFRMTDQIRAAMAKAHGELRALGARYQDRPPPDETLLVEAPFETATGGSQYLDVQVETIRGDTITGVLDDNPTTDMQGDYRFGSRVVVKIDNVLDYRHFPATGEMTGGEVDALVDQQDCD